MSVFGGEETGFALSSVAAVAGVPLPSADHSTWMPPSAWSVTAWPSTSKETGSVASVSSRRTMRWVSTYVERSARSSSQVGDVGDRLDDGAADGDGLFPAAVVGDGDVDRLDVHVARVGVRRLVFARVFLAPDVRHDLVGIGGFVLGVGRRRRIRRGVGSRPGRRRGLAGSGIVVGRSRVGRGLGVGPRFRVGG